MKQKITLQQGVVSMGRMKPFHPSTGARNTPAVKLNRLQQLLKSQHPNICIVRGEGVGDVIMTTPTVHQIKKMFGNVDITYATNTAYLGGVIPKVLQHNPDINHIIDRNLLDDTIYDLVINLHCPAISKERPGKIPPNRIDIFAQHAGVVLENTVPRYFIQREEVDFGEVILERIDPQNKVVLVQPFASNKNRSFDPGRLKQALIDLYQHHGIHSVVITHDGDVASDVLWNNIPGSIPAHNMDIRAIAGVMVHCDLVLCPDSSILHLAGALGVPTVGLFGPTPPQSRINHYRNAVAIWHGKDIPACPCWYESCPTGRACWDRITTSDIVDTCLTHLQNSKKVNIVHLLDKASPLQIDTEII